MKLHIWLSRNARDAQSLTRSGICQGCPWKHLQQRYFILLVHHGHGRDSTNCSWKASKHLPCRSWNYLMEIPWFLYLMSLGLIRVMTISYTSFTTTPAVVLWTSGVVPNNSGPPFSTGWQQHAFNVHAEGSHLGASLSRFWLGLNLKREMFLEGREGICTYSMQAAYIPRWSILTALKESRQSYNEGCSHFFPMQHELAFHINPTLFPPCTKSPQGRREI